MDRAVDAARRAFPSYSETSVEDRLALLQRIIDGFEARNDELAHAMTMEMGSPITFSNEVQTVNALTHFKEMISVLQSYEFERFMGGTLIRREPIGVVRPDHAVELAAQPDHVARSRRRSRPAARWC